MTSAQGQWWRRLHNWADVIHADFQTVISRVQQNISTCLFCTAERMLRTVMMQNSRLIQACFLSLSTSFESTDFASVMVDDVGCSGRHQCPQCGNWGGWYKITSNNNALHTRDRYNSWNGNAWPYKPFHANKTIRSYDGKSRGQIQGKSNQLIY